MRALFPAMAFALLIPAAVLALEPRQQQEFVTAHNRVRAMVGVPDLVWSDRLAALASAWANRLEEQSDCAPRHNPGNRHNGTGENIYWASPVIWSDGRQKPQEIAPATVVDAWAGESRDFDYARNACVAGRMCGHYTQMVWRDTREIGCGNAVCADGAQVWVCNYAPPGNVVGQQPY